MRLTSKDFIESCERKFGTAELLDTRYKTWDSRAWSVSVGRQKLIVTYFINRDDLRDNNFDVWLPNGAISSRIDPQKIDDVLQDLTVRDYTLPENTEEVSSKITEKGYFIWSMRNSGYAVNLFREGERDLLEFPATDPRKWMVSLNGSLSNCYVCAYRDGYIHMYDGGQMVPLGYPKLATSSCEVLCEELNQFGVTGKKDGYGSAEWVENYRSKS